ncbi:hypothetical protein PTKIN_Ptkin01aG0393200 [Pterospermum kingtungense]
MAPPSSSLVFTVHKHEPELVAPAKPTPHEYKLLSDIDDQDGLRCQIPIIQFYQYNPSMQGKDPARVIREALAQALVFYYPFAGRLREGPRRKLMVDCTGEGALFIEADAVVALDQFGDVLKPPFPCLEELLYDVPGSAGILNCPLLLVQVTRLRCGGFILAFRFNHTMSDGPAEISTLRKLLPQHLRNCSTFELLTACFWRCRTIALQVNPEEEVRMVCTVDARSKFNPPLPSGYYGNALAYAAAVAKAGELCENSLGYALQLVKQAKADVTEEHMKSLADMMVIKGRPHYAVVRSYLVSDATRAGLRYVDYGWGKAVYGAPAKGNVASFQIPFKNKKGEDGIIVTLALPAQAMAIFVKELDGMLKEKPIDENGGKKVLSSL